jgi:hypothetical protein
MGRAFLIMTPLTSLPGPVRYAAAPSLIYAALSAAGAVRSCTA